MSARIAVQETRPRRLRFLRSYLVDDPGLRRSAHVDALVLGVLNYLTARLGQFVSPGLLGQRAAEEGWGAVLPGDRAVRAALVRLEQRGAAEQSGRGGFRVAPAYRDRARAGGAVLEFDREDYRRPITRAAVLVAALVRGRSGATGWADSARWMAALLGSTRRGVQRALAQLRDVGAIEAVGTVKTCKGSPLVRRRATDAHAPSATQSEPRKGVEKVRAARSVPSSAVPSFPERRYRTEGAAAGGTPAAHVVPSNLRAALRFVGVACTPPLLRSLELRRTRPHEIVAAAAAVRARGAVRWPCGYLAAVLKRSGPERLAAGARSPCWMPPEVLAIVTRYCANRRPRLPGYMETG